MSQPVKQKVPKGSSNPIPSSNAITDPRFTNIQTDPRFRLPSKRTTHVKLDKRFAHMLRDDDFSKKASVDRYGRPLPKDQGRKELERFYVIDAEEEKAAQDDGVDANEAESGDDDDMVQRELARVERNYDPARDGGFSESSSDESSDEDLEEEEEEAEAEDAPGRLENEEIPMGDVSTRIAVVNLDWDNIKAADIFAVASSFCPPGGRVESVVIYPSEYGRERMEREDVEGPAPELFTSSTSHRANGSSTAAPPPEPESDDDDDDEESDDAASTSSEKIKSTLIAAQTADQPETDSRALRNYQLTRLRYYYAVITTSALPTASHIYTEMDGREYLSSANFFDLRFIPSHVTFDDPVTDRVHDECTQVPPGYKPKEFVTEALRHSKVRLTWDEDDAERKEVQKRAFSRQEVDENDLKAYVGGGSSEEESEEEVAPVDGAEATGDSKASKAQAARQKLRAALGLTSEPASKNSKRSKGAVDDDDEATGGMQVTFTAGISAEPAAGGAVFQNRPEDVKEETTRETYIRKERERKERRKAKAKAKRGDEEGSEAEDESQPAAVVSGKTKAKGPAAAIAATEDDPFNDPFFTDPAAANAAAKKATKAAKRAAVAAEEQAAAAKKQHEREELELLMAGEGAENGKGFDMAEIRKAEKEAAKRGKKGKGKRRKDAGNGAEAVAGVDDFEVDAQDPRFKALFESHEFAIDPSNPKFTATKGMKTLLEQGRKKRDRTERTSEAERAISRTADAHGSTKKREGKRRGDDDLDALVNKIKRKKSA